MVRAITRPYEIDQRPTSRVIVSGPEVALGEHAANGIALVFHDLCTNAAKYGALTRDTGSVELTWTMDKTNVVFGWKERGGPIVSGPPLSTGFCSQLVRATVEQSLSGTLNYDWGLEGAVITFEISLSNLNA